MLTLALAKGYGPYGWGICSENLIYELAKKTDVWVVPENQPPGRVNGKVLHAIAGMTFEPVHHVSGDYNAGYCFFEMDVLAETIKNARSFNHIFCGSSYNQKVLEACDIFHTSLLIQGIDPEIFTPAPPKKPDGKFVIFSGGKFEYRKGQDLVLAAFKALMDKFDQVMLSPVYTSTAVGFDGDDFINLVARVETNLQPTELRHFLRDLEDRYGRKRDVPKFSDRSLDVDILLYDDLVLLSPVLEIPRAEILKFSHVLRPLADLEPDLIHPTELRPMSEIWNSSGMDDSSLSLHPDF